MNAVTTYPDYSTCRLCPRECGVDRLGGARGVCGATAELRIASWGPHLGEEPCFTGRRGSGTIFFSGCPCHCLFCQNWQISGFHSEGHCISEDELERIAMGLIRRGVHNLNFVTPEHYWPHIEGLCAKLRAKGVNIPFLFNSSGYLRPAMIPRYAQHMDIFMPDFKFADPALAHTVMRDERYPELARESLRLMVAEKGFLEPFDPTGARTARQGVLVRHLVLPGHADNSRRVLDWLREDFGRWLPLALMSQYQPTPAARRQPPFDRPLTRPEYDLAVQHAQRLGFENILIQPAPRSDDFFPDFTRRNPFKGNPG